MRNPYATARAYRETDVLSAPPTRLVVLTFDGLLASMARARIGIATSNHEVTLPAVNMARSLLCDLLVALDRERGGDIASGLFSLYLFVLDELFQVSLHPKVERLDRSIALIRELRDAFDQIASRPKMQLS